MAKRQKPPSQGTGVGPFIKDVLANARDVAFIAAIFLYFSGFMYRYMYREVWGISSSDGDPQLYGYLVYGIFPLEVGWGRLLSIAVIALVTLAVIGFVGSRWWRPLLLARIGVIGVAVVLAFASLTTDAKRSAIQTFNEIRRGELTGSHLHFDDEAKARATYGNSFIKDNNNDLLSIVEETKESYYVLDQTNTAQAYLPDGVLVRVPKADVRYVVNDVVAPGQPH